MTRPDFIDRLSRAYTRKGKSLMLLTGDTQDLYWNGRVQEFLPLEQSLYQELSGKFTVLRVDAASGISFYSEDDERAVVTACQIADKMPSSREKVGDVRQEIRRNQHQPLPTLVLLRDISDAFRHARMAPESGLKPLCVVVQYAASIFPAGEFDRLGELDRQRLITFLNMVNDPSFAAGSGLLLLISDTRSEINSRILALPHTEAIQIDLPTASDRQRFVEHFLARGNGVQFSQGQQAFIEDSAGLKLTGVQDLLEVAQRSGEPISRKHVLEEVNARLEAELGDVVKIVRPNHSPADVIGYTETATVLAELFEDCEDPETAVPVMIVSGPNGGGKTFTMEAWADPSGRVVIRLAGLRSQWFGGTDILFEKLRLLIETYGKIMIMVDEAHTQFGSVHDSDTHKTEKRLAGNIISMMSNPAFLGKVVWVLMTSRPDELDPDIKSRAPEQIPIFDLEGDARRSFVAEMFARKGIQLSEEELTEVMQSTEHFSNRDFKNLVGKVKAKQRRNPELTVVEVLRKWRASTSIILERELQKLIAAQHCSYPDLLPEDLRNMQASELQNRVDELRALLHR